MHTNKDYNKYKINKKIILIIILELNKIQFLQPKELTNRLWKSVNSLILIKEINKWKYEKYLIIKIKY